MTLILIQLWPFLKVTLEIIQCRRPLYLVIVREICSGLQVGLQIVPREGRVEKRPRREGL